MENKHYYALTFVAEDRPGIVSDVSKLLFEKGFNIEDSSSTLLRGFFSMILIVSMDKLLPLEDIIDKFSSLSDMSVSAKYADNSSYQRDGSSYVISVYGSDKPGIVYSVADFLAKNNINILDLQTKVAGKGKKPVYVMILEVIVPIETDNKWNDEIKLISKNLGVDISIRPIETYEF